MSQDMHIKSIDIYKADIAFHEPFRIAIMEIKSAASVFIRIRTEGMGRDRPDMVAVVEKRI